MGARGHSMPWKVRISPKERVHNKRYFPKSLALRLMASIRWQYRDRQSVTNPEHAISQGKVPNQKGWGAIAKLKKKQELLVRFGYNLGELFRDSPWSYNPLYTQIGQVNKSTLRVNTMDAVTEILSTKQREGLVRFGYNLGELFRDSPWSYNPLYTQIRQVKKSTLRVNTMDTVTETSSAKQRERLVWFGCN